MGKVLIEIPDWAFGSAIVIETMIRKSLETAGYISLDVLKETNIKVIEEIKKEPQQ